VSTWAPALLCVAAAVKRRLRAASAWRAPAPAQRAHCRSPIFVSRNTTPQRQPSGAVPSCTSWHGVCAAAASSVLCCPHHRQMPIRPLRRRQRRYAHGRTLRRLRAPNFVPQCAASSAHRALPATLVCATSPSPAPDLAVCGDGPAHQSPFGISPPHPVLPGPLLDHGRSGRTAATTATTTHIQQRAPLPAFLLRAARTVPYRTIPSRTIWYGPSSTPPRRRNPPHWATAEYAAHFAFQAAGRQAERLAEEPGFPAEVPSYFCNTSHFRSHAHARALMQVQRCPPPLKGCLSKQAPRPHTRPHCPWHPHTAAVNR
jgi:hypothetical protein